MDPEPQRAYRSPKDGDLPCVSSNVQGVLRHICAVDMLLSSCDVRFTLLLKSKLALYLVWRQQAFYIDIFDMNPCSREDRVGFITS